MAENRFTFIGSKLFAKIMSRGHNLLLAANRYEIMWSISQDENNDIVKVYKSLLDLILYVPSTIFLLNRDGSSWTEPVLS